MLRNLFGLRAGPRNHAVGDVAKLNYGSIDLRSMNQITAPAYGRIPYGVNDAKLPFERIAYGFCPGCGAPRKHELCEYCGGRHRLNELEFRRKATLNDDPDNSCPSCGDTLDRAYLYGDNVIIAAHASCTNCGYQGGTR